MSPALEPIVPPRNSKLDKKLAAYTLAGAAAFATPALAHADGITYLPNVDTTVPQGNSYSFNLSGPSSADVVLSAALGTVNNGNAVDPSNNITFATNNNAEVYGGGIPGNADPLAAGGLLDPSNPNGWNPAGKLGNYDTVTNTTQGLWSPGTDAFLGFYFQGTNGPQAGWAEVTTGAADASFEVLSYAYQDQANTPILAGQTAATPEPGTMALIALGAAGLFALRRRRAATR
jgi:hypothetical protein